MGESVSGGQRCEDIFGIDYMPGTVSPRRWFELACQVASGSPEFQKTGQGFSADPGDGNEEIQERAVELLGPAAKFWRKRHHLDPDIKFKVVETDPPPPPPEEPDWRERREEWFGDLCIEWNTGSRQFLVARQVASGSEDFAGIGTVVVSGPGDSREDILSNLRFHAEFDRESQRLSPDIKYKAVEIEPRAPVRQDNVPESIWRSTHLDRPDGGPAAEKGDGTCQDETEPGLARCGQCEHVFLTDAICGSTVECDRCGATAAWYLRMPGGSQGSPASPHKLNVDQLRLFTGLSFERFLNVLFATIGFSVDAVSLTTEQGADLIIVDGSGRRVAVQAKRYSQDVGNAAVQEILGGMAYWGCERGIVVSASGFTRAAEELAGRAPAVILWDKAVLQVLIDRYMSDVVVFIADKQPSSGGLATNP